MKYTKNAGTKLLNMGFKFKSNYKDDEIEYDVYQMIFTGSINNCIEATVCPTDRKVTFFLVFEDSIEFTDYKAVSQFITQLKKVIK